MTTRSPNTKTPVIRPQKPSYAGARGMSRRELFDHVQSFQKVQAQTTKANNGTGAAGGGTATAAPPAGGGGSVPSSIIPSNLAPLPLTVGDTSDPGLSLQVSRFDHIHAMPGPFLPAGTGHAPGFVPDPGAVAHTTTPYYMGDDGLYHQISNGTGITVAWGGGGTGAVTITAPVFVASGASHAVGVVPDPGASAGTTRFLREDASWAVPPGGGGSSPYTVPILANFTVANTPAGATSGDSTTGLVLSCPTNGLKLYALTDNTAPVGSFTLTAGFRVSALGSNAGCGIFVEDGTGKIAAFGIDTSSANAANYNYWTDYNNFSSNPLNTDNVDRSLFVRIVKNGSNFDLYSGADLNSVILIQSFSATAFIGTPTLAGIYVFGFNQTISATFFHYLLV